MKKEKEKRKSEAGVGKGNGKRKSGRFKDSSASNTRLYIFLPVSIIFGYVREFVYVFG